MSSWSFETFLSNTGYRPAYLKNINLTLQKNISLSIVGVNGAGKTTLIKLLCRLYAPTSGEILLNGVNIQEYAYDEYIDLIGTVFQDFKLFNFSVRENVSFDENANEEKVLQCLRMSGLGEKISRLAAGIDTNISKEFDSGGLSFPAARRKSWRWLELFTRTRLLLCWMNLPPRWIPLQRQKFMQNSMI